MKTGPRHVVRETEDGSFQMTIKSALRSDAGVYTCKIVNEYGAKQCEGKLQVKGEVPKSQLLARRFSKVCQQTSYANANTPELQNHVEKNSLFIIILYYLHCCSAH